jgi:hypothetical protein
MRCQWLQLGSVDVEDLGVVEGKENKFGVWI